MLLVMLVLMLVRLCSCSDVTLVVHFKKTIIDERPLHFYITAYVAAFLKVTKFGTSTKVECILFSK